MGILADIYISGDDAAVKYDTDPEQFPDRVQYKGFTPLELSMLWSIMHGVEWHVSMLDELPCIFQQGGRYIHRLPKAMVADLSRLTPEQIALVSSKWAAIEELQWSAEAASEVIEDLVQLANRASKAKQNLYLWNCV